MTREKELILVVDDSPTNLAILNVVLREVYNVVTATNGPDALNLAASEEPDLIILDIMMPGMDGYEICDRLKANPFTKDIPVMFVTAMDQERQEAKGLAMGAVDYLAKPQLRGGFRQGMAPRRAPSSAAHAVAGRSRPLAGL